MTWSHCRLHGLLSQRWMMTNAALAAALVTSTLTGCSVRHCLFPTCQLPGVDERLQPHCGSLITCTSTRVTPLLCYTFSSILYKPYYESDVRVSGSRRLPWPSAMLPPARTLNSPAWVNQPQFVEHNSLYFMVVSTGKNYVHKKRVDFHENGLRNGSCGRFVSDRVLPTTPVSGRRSARTPWSLSVTFRIFYPLCSPQKLFLEESCKFLTHFPCHP